MIHFFTESTSYTVDFPVSAIIDWLQAVASQQHFIVISLTYVLCSDEYILKINQEYLQHDYYTDIITFDNSDFKHEIEGDIFISIDRVQENTSEHSVSFHHELYRVIVHGLLHLIGFNDKTEEDTAAMREMENNCLHLLFNRL